MVNRERNRYFDESQPVVTTTTASEDVIRMQRVLSADGKEVRLYCQSDKRAEKETAMAQGFMNRFEAGLSKLAEGLVKPRCEKRLDKINERIGRLKERGHGIAQHYTINLIADETGKKAASLTWEKNPVANSMLTHPGVYCLRSNETSWDEATLWHTYTMLTDVEAVFRSLKSELGLRPIYHHTAERTEGASLYHRLGISGSTGTQETTQRTKRVRQLVEITGNTDSPATRNNHLQAT